MKSVNELPKNIRYVFTDIDDTLTTDGRLPAESYEALWSLHKADIKVIPVTGRPAGWCDMIARMWPVDAVIGENGALAFYYQDKKMHQLWASDPNQLQDQIQKLEVIRDEILTKIPGAGISADQFARIFDLAVDFCEDVAPLSKSEVDQIVEIFKAHGAQAKVSSIHVNGWFGDHNKLTMCKTLSEELFGKELQDLQKEAVFAGDSPNDEPMFGFFDHSVAVANIKEFIEDLNQSPKYLCNEKGGAGFVELSRVLLAK